MVLLLQLHIGIGIIARTLKYSNASENRICAFNIQTAIKPFTANFTASVDEAPHLISHILCTEH